MFFGIFMMFVADGGLQIYKIGNQVPMDEATCDKIVKSQPLRTRTWVLDDKVVKYTLTCLPWRMK